jgi:hypothetical protein
MSHGVFKQYEPNCKDFINWGAKVDAPTIINRISCASVSESVGAIAPWLWVYNCNASAMYRLPYNNNNLRTVPKRALQHIMTRKKWSFSHWEKNQKFWQQQTGSTQQTYRGAALKRGQFPMQLTPGTWIYNFFVRRFKLSWLVTWNFSDMSQAKNIPCFVGFCIRGQIQKKCNFLLIVFA